MFYGSLQSQIWISRRPLNLNDLLTKFCRARAVLGNLLGWTKQAKFGLLARIWMDNPGWSLAGLPIQINQTAKLEGLFIKFDPIFRLAHKFKAGLRFNLARWFDLYHIASPLDLKPVFNRRIKFSRLLWRLACFTC